MVEELGGKASPADETLMPLLVIVALPRARARGAVTEFSPADGRILVAHYIIVWMNSPQT